VREPSADKSAVLTRDIELPGRRLVLAPRRSGIALSRAIRDADERRRLSEIASALLAGQENIGEGGSGGGEGGSGGLILRSAAAGAAPETLAAEFARLAAHWRGIAAEAGRARPPALLHDAGAPLRRLLWRHAPAGLDAIFTDDAGALAALRGLCAEAWPELAARLALWREPEPLFARDEVEAQIETARAARVPLPSGGWIAFGTTEALTAVDVNAGRASGQDAAAARRVNAEAAAEIARQLRLRAIGGLIVVDFITASGRAALSEAAAALRAGLAADGESTHIEVAGRTGAVVLTRQRRGPSLTERLTRACPVCDGHGRLARPETVGRAALRRAERVAAAAPGRPLVIAAAPETIAWFEGEADLLASLRRRSGGPVAMRARADWPPERFEVFHEDRS
jgi:ribonuclease G